MVKATCRHVVDAVHLAIGAVRTQTVVVHGVEVGVVRGCGSRTYAMVALCG